MWGVSNSVSDTQSMRPARAPAVTPASDDNAPASPVGFPALALWFGLVTSLAELAVLAFEHFVLAWERQWAPLWAWMSPLCYLAGFGVLGVLLAAVLRRRTGRALGVGVFVLAWAAASSFLFLFGKLDPAAGIVLAAGVAARAAAWARARPERLTRLVRRTWRPFAGLATAAALAAVVVPLARERIMIMRLPAAAAGAPNVVFIFLDTVRAWNLSLYGYGRPTSPELDRFAARGVVFDRAIAPSSWTLTTHLSAFSGLMPSEMTGLGRLDYDNPLPHDRPVLSEVFAGRGYVTAGFVANQYFASREFGLDRGFARYEDYPVSIGSLILSTAPGRRISINGRVRRLLDYHDLVGRKRADRITDDFLTWQASHGDRPFFAFLNYYDAHEPYVAPPAFSEQFAKQAPEAGYFYEPFRGERLNMEDVPADEVRRQMDMYDAAIASQDAELGRLFDALENRGLADNTIVVVVSDHGEEFMEHGRVGHVRNAYMSVIHVPLVVVAPGRVPAGVRVSPAVTLVDLPATILDLTGVEQPAAMPGTSLAAFWNGGPAPLPRPILGEVNPGPDKHKSLIVGRYHLLRRTDEPLELYDLSTDPREQVNLASLPSSRAQLTRLVMLMDSLLAPAGRPGAPSMSDADAN